MLVSSLSRYVISDTYDTIPVLRRDLGRTTTQHHICITGQLSLAIPSWVGAMSTSQRAVMPCGWGVKAGMVRVWVAGKTV